jgi:hypothetical protein
MGIGFINKLDKKFAAKGFEPDGFDIDSDPRYQMVPVGGERDLIVETNASPCELSLDENIGTVAIRNFRFLETGQQVPNSPDGATMFRLPANATIRFSVKGNGPGFARLRFTETGEFQISHDMVISVKPPLTRKFSFIFISDLARSTVRGKIEPRFLLDSVKKVFNVQANVQLEDIDSGGAFREVHVLTDLGNPIDLDDDSKRHAIDDRVRQDFPGLFAQTDFVVYLVWRVRGKHRKLVGLNVQSSTKLNTVYLGLEPEGSAGRIHTMAHEFGHAMGLPHAREDCLMFPTTAVQSNRLLGGHIEQLRTGPIPFDP